MSHVFRGIGLGMVIAFVGVAACVGDDPVTSDNGGGDGGGSEATTTDSPSSSDAACALTMCGSSCVDTTSSASNCGGCGVTCDGATCADSVCGGNDILDFAAGDQFSCVVRRAGTVWCFGGNDQRQLGHDPSADPMCGTTPCQSKPTLVAGMTDAISVDARDGFACAIKKDHSLWCWGTNAQGQLGHDPSTDTASCGGTKCTETPTQVAGLSNVTKVALGSASTCAIANAPDGGTGSVYCWGDDTDGQLGRGGAIPGTSTFSPVIPITMDSGAVDLVISIGASTVMARKADGSLWAWGINTGGAGGHASGGSGDVSCGANCEANSTPTEATFTALAPSASALSAGESSICALSGSSVQCWGYGGWGLLGPSGLAANSATPIAITLPSISEIAGHGYHACALADDRSVYCWGLAEYGERGNGEYQGGSVDAGSTNVCNGTRLCDPNAVQIPGGFLATSVVSGAFTTFALKADGTLWGWGDNTEGELGHSPLMDVTCATSDKCAPLPVQVAAF